MNSLYGRPCCCWRKKRRIGDLDTRIELCVTSSATITLSNFRMSFFSQVTLNKETQLCYSLAKSLFLETPARCQKVVSVILIKYYDAEVASCITTTESFSSAWASLSLLPSPFFSLPLFATFAFATLSLSLSLSLDTYFYIPTTNRWLRCCPRSGDHGGSTTASPVPKCLSCEVPSLSSPRRLTRYNFCSVFTDDCL